MNWTDIYLNKKVIRKATLTSAISEERRNILKFLALKGFDVKKTVVIYPDLNPDDIIYSQKID